MAAGEDLVAWRYTKLGWPRNVAIMCDYVWDSEAEVFPGARIIEMLEKRVTPVDAPVKGEVVELDQATAKAFPTLHKHLTQARWPDGSPRETSTLNIWHDGTAYRAMLRDRDGGLVLFVTCPTLAKLLHTVNGASEATDADWRKDKQAAPKGQRKK